jgi:hypothetical protein
MVHMFTYLLFNSDFPKRPRSLRCQVRKSTKYQEKNWNRSTNHDQGGLNSFIHRIARLFLLAPLGSGLASPIITQAELHGCSQDRCLSLERSFPIRRVSTSKTFTKSTNCITSSQHIKFDYSVNYTYLTLSDMLNGKELDVTVICSPSPTSSDNFFSKFGRVRSSSCGGA